MRFACWINKATDTHSENLTFIAFPQQQWLHESAIILLYAHCLSCLLEFAAFGLQFVTTELSNYGEIPVNF